MTTYTHKVHTAVIGAGSAGLVAFRHISKERDDVLLIDHGPLGSTCARIGCMPSKVLIHIARDFYRRHSFKNQGIHGAEQLSCNLRDVMAHVRHLRDRFVRGMVRATEELAGERLIQAHAVLLDQHHIQAGSHYIEAERIIIATGTKPLVPEKWAHFSDRIYTSETIFEQETFPRRVAVIGLGPIGLELGQALARLGVEITAFDTGNLLGGLSDTQVNDALQERLSQEFPLYTNVTAEIEMDGDELVIKAGEQHIHTDAILAAMGTIPNLDNMGLETLGYDPGAMDKNIYDEHTGQIGDLPVYVAGDANKLRPILHEALDDGMHAAEHALHGKAACACRRVPLRMVFCDPEVIVVGTPFSALPETGTVTGTIDFTEQARAIIDDRNAGRLNVYVDEESGQLLGAEGVAPDAGHLGHLLALAIQQQYTVFDLLQMPFYHPTLTEALETAFRDAAKHCSDDRKKKILDWCCVETPLH